MQTEGKLLGVMNLGRLTFFILKDSSSSLSTARMFSMGMLHRAPSPGSKKKPHKKHKGEKIFKHRIVLNSDLN